MYQMDSIPHIAGANRPHHVVADDLYSRNSLFLFGGTVAVVHWTFAITEYQRSSCVLSCHLSMGSAGGSIVFRRNLRSNINEYGI